VRWRTEAARDLRFKRSSPAIAATVVAAKSTLARRRLAGPNSHFMRFSHVRVSRLNWA
jgi:hypothetical protein